MLPAPRFVSIACVLLQVLDVQWQDKQLCGFSGGFSTIKANSTRRR